MSIINSKKLQSVNPETVDRSMLVQRNTVKINPEATKEERIRQFVEQIKNPYCYLEGNTVVKIQFADTDTTIEDCFVNYLSGI